LGQKRPKISHLPLLGCLIGKEVWSGVLLTTHAPVTLVMSLSRRSRSGLSTSFTMPES
jgi:hypothetical protein